MRTPKFYTYKEWITIHPELLKEQEEAIEDCSECDGTGTIECSECGEDRDCPECDGEGKIIKFDAQQEYERQKRRDKQLWDRTMSTIKQ